MDGFNTRLKGIDAGMGGGGGDTPQDSKSVKYIAQALTDAQKAQARENIGGARSEGEEPNLTAGNIIPKSSELNVVIGHFSTQTTGGDNDLKTGPSLFEDFRGHLDENFNPFIADSFVSTGMNLVDPAAHVTISSNYAYIFPVRKGAWGSYGTTQENNGYVINSDTAPNAVYFKATKPTGSSHGEACPTHVENGKTYYLPPTDGWLCIAMPNKTSVPACHVAWSNSKDNEAGTFGNTVKAIAAAIQWIHPWGMANLIGPDYSVFDEVDVIGQKCYRYTDRLSLASLTWTMTTETSGEGEGETTHYIFKANVSTMKADGLWRANYDGIELSGNTLTIRSTSITSVADLQTDLGSSFIYIELATPASATFASISLDLTADNVSNDYGLTYFLYNGDLVSVPAYVTEAFGQSGKDPLYNAVAYQKLLAEVVATVMNSVDERLKSLEQKKDVVCDNLIVNRRAGIVGWREVDAAPASATAEGTQGDYFIATDYIYICVAANTWKRAALSTF